MRIYIDDRVCKGCGLCVHICPHNVLQLSDRRNQKGYTIAEAKTASECIGCRLCEVSCPDLAIYIAGEE